MMPVRRLLGYRRQALSHQLAQDCAWASGRERPRTASSTTNA